MSAAKKKNKAKKNKSNQNVNDKKVTSQVVKNEIKNEVKNEDEALSTIIDSSEKKENISTTDSLPLDILMDLKGTENTVVTDPIVKEEVTMIKKILRILSLNHYTQMLQYNHYIYHL